jgi:hypothetical protein
VQETEQTFMLGTPAALETKGAQKRKRRRRGQDGAATAETDTTEGKSGKKATSPTVRRRSPFGPLRSGAFQLNYYPITELPKHNTTFCVLVPVPPATAYQEATALLEMEVYGNQMKYQLPTRATKKAKAKKTIEY